MRKLLLLACGLVCSASGCSSDRLQTYPANGRVVFPDGQPVKLGTVELLSVEHRINATGTIKPDGTFVLGTYTSDDGACGGEHRVIIMQMIINDGITKHQLDHGAPVDPLYGSYTSSPLMVTIKPDDKNQIELVVEKAKPL